MKIGLMGCEFASPNKGCEALTYSFLSILEKICGDKEKVIIYNFSGTGLGKVPVNFCNFEYIDISPKLKDLSFSFIKALKKCDIIFDATMGDSFSDIYSIKDFNWNVRNKLLAELLCRKYILLPQTYGPFYNKKSEKKAYRVLKKAKKIYCRDELSKTCIEKMPFLNNTELSTDMAFFLPYDKKKYKFENNKKIKVGINISGLLYKGGFISNNQFNLKLDYKEYVKNIIEYLLSKNKYDIYIIPHVIDISQNAHDDDYIICQEIHSIYKQTFLAPKFDNPIDAKSYISNMDMFIGSRMHSTIAAFSSGVVTIPVSYSRKFEGLFNSLNYDFVINGKEESTESAIDKTLKYIENSSDLKSCQYNSQKTIENLKNKFVLSLEQNLIIYR